MPIPAPPLEKMQAVLGGLKRRTLGRTRKGLVRPRDVQPLTRDALYERAVELADEHIARVLGRGSRTLYKRFSENCIQLDIAYRVLSEAALNKEFLTPGAEWLLDNYHIIQKQIQDIKRHFPRGYDRSLPKLVSGEYAGYPRVYHLALELLRNSDSVVGVEILSSFINGYQAKQVLTLGELWAVPIMLRFALIENLGALAGRMVGMREERKEAEGLVDEILGEETQAGTQILLELASRLVDRPEFVATGAPYLLRRLRERGRRASLTVQWFEERLREEGLEPEEVLRNEQYLLAADQISIGNSFTSLKAINYVDWKGWVESVSKVHQTLQRDPSQVYARCDFKTRDLYRHHIELLAKRSKCSELEVAEQALALARGERTTRYQSAVSEGPGRAAESAVPSRVHSLVGFYLIGGSGDRSGRLELEQTLGTHPGVLRQISRLVRAHPLAFYLGPIAVFSAWLLFEVLRFSVRHGADFVILLTVAVISAVALTEIATALVQWIITWVVPPDQLPKFDFKEGIPDDCQTVVVVQSIFPDADIVTKSFEALEVRYLANIDKNVSFGILADLPDADAEEIAEDRAILQRAEQCLEELRARHPDGRFFMLFRRRRWNAAQGRWLGWERKRGKIEEFNRLLLGRGETSFILDEDVTRILRDIRYVVTLDNDSQLPRGVVRTLVGTIHHPLNAPELDAAKQRVVRGYSIIQPRMGVSLLSANASRFAAIFSGHAGLDPYTQTVSEVYQDLFQEGSFIGKGIYDVEAFARVLEHRVPENALLSHDLFEGNHVRVALASDVELYDDFPSRYHVHARRLHRWVRGDWQLLPWLRRRVPGADGNRIETLMTPLGRYKLFDNLRRSLVAPSLFLIFLGGGTVFPGPFGYWLALVLLVVATPIYLNIAQAFLIPARGLSITSHVWGVGRDLMLMSKRTVLTLSFIPYQAFSMTHAIFLTLWRMYISKRHLLDWESAFVSERRLGNSPTSYFREMSGGLFCTVASAALILLYRPEAFPAAFPLLLLWTAAPWLARTLSLAPPAEAFEIKEQDREYLFTIAWKTWRYFRQYLCPEHNYLIPDNLQLVPEAVAAPRTSPTNISLSMLSALSAYDLGFVTMPMALDRVLNTFRSLAKLERFRGHFLNWYNTRTLDPLLPRYVSFVDSGNLVGHLIAARTAFREFSDRPLLSERHLLHVERLLREAVVIVNSLSAERSATAMAEIEALRGHLLQPIENLRELYQTLLRVRDAEDKLPEIVSSQSEKSEVVDRLLVLDEEAGEITRVLTYFAWLPLYDIVLSKLRAAGIDEKEFASLEHIEALVQMKSITLRSLKELLLLLIRFIGEIEAMMQPGGSSNHPLVDERSRTEIHQLAMQLDGEVKRSLTHVQGILDTLVELIQNSSRIINELDFTFLYDGERELFAIGYDISNARRDGSFYDLLASEARLGSFVAVALGQVPQQHWFALGRPLTASTGGRALISWGGTMFEYLMPNLMTKNFPGTLLAETSFAAVKAQQQYGAKLGVPWGVSESGYSGVDFEKTYQYHAFGVPGLGLKRGLEEDLVISPYSTVLALPVLPGASIDNLRALEEEGMLGEYGFYEAADYTPERLSVNEKKHIVQSFFAHHQGMSLISLNNFLSNNVFQERFHADQQVKATELLLQERFPDRVPVIIPHTAHLFPLEREAEATGHFTLQKYTTPHTEVPATHLLSNGHYAVMVDNAGSGFSSFDRELMLTRWREDAQINALGTHFFLRDVDHGHVWSAAYQPTLVEPESYEVFFGPDKIEFKRTDHEIFLHQEITVSPEDNVEIRRLSLTNLSSKRRVIELTSYGEVVLTTGRADAAHPAFSKMFIQSEVLPEYDALLFSRRPRSVHEERAFLLHMITQKVVWDRVTTESSRFQFIGRGNTLRTPRVMLDGTPLSNTVGLVLDPIFSLRTKVEIEPGQTESLTYITAYSRSRDEILGYAARYKELHHISRAFEMAWSQSGVELRNERSAAKQWHIFQRLGNALLFNVERLRGRPETIAKNRLPQQSLWRFGIGGDYPICLIRVTEPDQTKLVQELLLAHNFLRMRGLIFELVVLNEYPGGYLQNLQEELEYLVRASPSGGLIDKKGGVFLRTTVQISEDERELLQTVARVVLTGMRGTLEQQLRGDERTVDVPAVHRRWVGPKTELMKLKHVEKSEFYNGCGGFTDGGSTYAMSIADNLPPLPWSNVVANPNFGFLVTETGAGYTWADNCRENRLTPWSNDPVSDPPGEVIYIRDEISGAYWNPTPRPAVTTADYLVEHRIGSSVFTTEVDAIESSLELQIGPEDQIKWYVLRLTNHDTVTRDLELYFYVDWVLGVSREESYRHHVTSFNERANCLLAVNHFNADFAGRIGYVGSSHEISGYTSSRQEFIGRNRDLSAPAALQMALRTHSHILQHSSHATAGGSVHLSRKVGAGFDSCGLIRVALSLPAKSGELVLFYLGQAPNVEQVVAASARYSNPHTAANQSAKHREVLGKLTTSVQVTTPDRSLDLLMNGWLVYQVYSARVFARTGFYQSGGAWGFRDQLQDVLAFLPSAPELTRNQILLHASRQFPEGDCQHWWHPPSGKGVRTRISDDYLWLPFVTERYLEVTGDTGILDEQVSYIEGPKLGDNEHEAYIVPHPSGKSGTLFEHCITALDRALVFGQHGLPLMGCGDWNDGMNEVGKNGKGESVWLGWFLLLVLQRFAPVCSARGDSERASRYLTTAAELAKNIEREAWDGGWYRRAYFDDGKPLGSRTNDECQIDSLAQTWGIISGAANPERAAIALAAANERLVDRNFGIIKLLYPPFDQGTLLPGYIKGYLPGIRENGGQYTHAAAWMVIAHAIQGAGKHARDLFQLINPIEHTSSPERVARYQGEPYAFCGDVYAVAPHEGRAGWSWYTGSAGWMFQAGLEYILGLKLHPGHFSVDPCVPSDWERFTLEYRRKGTTFKIGVSNPNGVERGVETVKINGQLEATKNIVYDKFKVGETVAVEVVMG